MISPRIPGTWVQPFWPKVVPGRKRWGWQPEGQVSLVAMLLWMDVEKAGKVGVWPCDILCVYIYIFP